MVEKRRAETLELYPDHYSAREVEVVTWELVVHPWCGEVKNHIKREDRIRGELTPEIALKIAPMINDYVKHEYIAAKRLKKGVN